MTPSKLKSNMQSVIRAIDNGTAVPQKVQRALACGIIALLEILEDSTNDVFQDKIDEIRSRINSRK